MKDEILEIIQKNYKEYKGSNEAELASAEELELIFEKEVLKGKIEVLEEVIIDSKSNITVIEVNQVLVKYEQQLKKLNNE